MAANRRWLCWVRAFSVGVLPLLVFLASAPRGLAQGGIVGGGTSGNGGTMRVGGNGTFNFTNFEQSETGALELAVSPAGSGLFIVRENAVLRGTARLDFASGFQPEDDESFPILTAGKLTGQFDWVDVSGAPAPAGRQWQMNYVENSATFTLVPTVRDRDIRIDFARRRGTELFVGYTIVSPAPLDPYAIAVFETTERPNQLVPLLTHQVTEDRTRAAGSYSIRLDGAGIRLDGGFRLLAVIDGGQRIVESDEGNNIAPFTVLPEP